MLGKRFKLGSTSATEEPTTLESMRPAPMMPSEGLPVDDAFWGDDGSGRWQDDPQFSRYAENAAPDPGTLIAPPPPMPQPAGWDGASVDWATPAPSWDLPAEATVAPPAPAPVYEAPVTEAPVPGWDLPTEAAPAPTWDAAPPGPPTPIEPANWDLPTEAAPAPTWDAAPPAPAPTWDAAPPAPPTPAEPANWDLPTEAAPAPTWDAAPPAPPTWDAAPPAPPTWDAAPPAPPTPAEPANWDLPTEAAPAPTWDAAPPAPPTWDAAPPAPPTPTEPANCDLPTEAPPTPTWDGAPPAPPTWDPAPPSPPTPTEPANWDLPSEHFADLGAAQTSDEASAPAAMPVAADPGWAAPVEDLGWQPPASAEPSVAHDTPADPIATWDTPAEPIATWDTPAEPIATWDTPAEPIATWDTPTDTSEPAANTWDTPAQPEPTTNWDTPAEPAWDTPTDTSDPAANTWDAPAQPEPTTNWDTPAEPAWDTPTDTPEPTANTWDTPAAEPAWDTPAQPEPATNWDTPAEPAWDTPTEAPEPVAEFVTASAPTSSTQWEPETPTAATWDLPTETPTGTPTWDTPTEAAPAPTWDLPTEAAPAPTWDTPTEAAPAPTWDLPTEAAPAPTWDLPIETPAAAPSGLAGEEPESRPERTGAGFEIVPPPDAAHATHDDISQPAPEPMSTWTPSPETLTHGAGEAVIVPEPEWQPPTDAPVWNLGADGHEVFEAPESALVPLAHEVDIADTSSSLPALREDEMLPEHLLELKRRAQEALIERMGARLYDRTLTEDQLENLVLVQLDGFLHDELIQISPSERMALTDDLINDVLRHGPIERYLQDPSVSEVMVNGIDNIYVERGGKLQRANATFLSEAHLRQIIERIVSKVGRRIDESSPMVDARLPDGSRVNAVVPPLAVDGPSLTIRKFSQDSLTIQDLVQYGTLSPTSVQFLSACVRGRMNVLVSGGTGTGKTTLLNVLSNFIPDDERIVTIEDAVELQLRQNHIVRLESRPPNVEGKGQITIRDLVRNSLRMRPDRVIIGECRGGEALDMLQAMNTGHDGSLSTLHANGPRDCIARLETLCLMAGMELPIKAIREQIASAVDLIVHIARLRDGSRRVTHVTEVAGLDGERMLLGDIFTFDFDAGLDAEGRYAGLLESTGLIPGLLSRLKDHGIEVPSSLFESEDAESAGSSW